MQFKAIKKNILLLPRQIKQIYFDSFNDTLIIKLINYRYICELYGNKGV